MIMGTIFNCINGYNKHFNLKKYHVQSAKILLLPPKYGTILCHPIIQFSSIAVAKLDFSQLLNVKLSLLFLFVSFFVSVLSFFFDGRLSKVIAPPTFAISIVVSFSPS